MSTILSVPAIQKAVTALLQKRSSGHYRQSYQPYPGESDAKRFARASLYMKANALWSPGGGIPGSLAVVLAGPHAPEVGALRHFLRWPAKDVLFVDVVKRHLDAVKRRWPQARTFLGPISDAIQSVGGSIGFINYDFMGALNGAAEASIASARGKLAPRAIVAYTFHRGREDDRTPWWKYMKSLTRRTAGTVEARDAVRMIGYSFLLARLLGHKWCTPIYRMRYTANGCHMGVVAVQNMPPEFRTSPWATAVCTMNNHEEKDGMINERSLEKSLGTLVNQTLLETPCQRVSALFNIPIGRIVAAIE